MQISDIPFGTTDWHTIERAAHKGERGATFRRTHQFGTIRVHIVEYTSGYLAAHWRRNGHMLLCLEGELLTELEDVRTFTLRPGMSN